MSPIRLIAAVLLLLPALGAAETFYVTDQVLAGLYAQPNPNSEMLAALPTGTPLEVTDMREGYFRVKVQDGQEGWISANFISEQPPAMSLLLRLREEHQRTTAELERVKAQRRPALWIVVITGFALFGIGVLAGIAWLDHRIRVRHGGFRI